jgi:hypothetical protein
MWIPLGNSRNDCRRASIRTKLMTSKSVCCQTNIQCASARTNPAMSIAICPTTLTTAHRRAVCIPPFGWLYI